MLDELDFAKKDFKNRKYQSLLTFIGLVICVASTTFLLQIGLSLWLPNIFRGIVKTTSFLVNATLKFVTFDTFLVFFIGMLNVSFLTSTMMSNRIRDIGLIKAMGSINSKDHSYIMSGPLLLILLGCMIGAIIGTGIFAFVLVFFLQISFLEIVIGVAGFFGVFILTFLFAWFIAGYQIENALKTTTIDSLTGDTSAFDFKKEQMGTLKNIIRRLPFSIQTVTRGILRSRTKSKTAIICIAASMLLLTVSFVGGLISWYTTRNYVDMAYGQNIIAIGNQEVLVQYVDLNQPSLKPEEAQNSHNFNFLNPDFMINPAFVSELSSNPQVKVIDNRLITFAQITEVSNFTIEFDETDRNSPHYVTIGDHRITNSLILGIEPTKTVSVPWNQKGTTLLEKDNATAIGDAVARNLFADPYRESLNISSTAGSTSQPLSITNVVIDPLNQGNTVYLSLQTIQSLFLTNRTNLILLKVTGTQQAMQEITALVQKYNLTALNMNNVRQQSLLNVDKIWLSILPFPILSMVTAAIGLLNTMSISMAGRLNDFGIIRAIGAKPNYVIKAIFLETLILVSLTAPIGIILGMLFNLIFLIPSPELTTQVLLLSFGTIIATILLIISLTTVITVRAIRKSPVKILQESH